MPKGYRPDNPFAPAEAKDPVVQKENPEARRERQKPYRSDNPFAPAPVLHHKPVIVTAERPLSMPPVVVRPKMGELPTVTVTAKGPPPKPLAQRLLESFQKTKKTVGIDPADLAQPALGVAEGVVDATGRAAAGLEKIQGAIAEKVRGAITGDKNGEYEESGPGYDYKVPAERKRILAKIGKVTPPTTGRAAVERTVGKAGGFLAPFIAAGPAGVAAGAGLNALTEAGSEPEESMAGLLEAHGMVPKGTRSSTLGRAATGVAGDVAVAGPLAILRQFAKLKAAEELARKVRIPKDQPVHAGSSESLRPRETTIIGATDRPAGSRATSPSDVRSTTNRSPSISKTPGAEAMKAAPETSDTGVTLGESAIPTPVKETHTTPTPQILTEKGGKVKTKIHAEHGQPVLDFGKTDLDSPAWKKIQAAAERHKAEHGEIPQQKDPTWAQPEGTLNDLVTSLNMEHKPLLKRAAVWGHDGAGDDFVGVVDPGVKTVQSIENKIGRKAPKASAKGVEPHRVLGDISRGSVIVQSAKDVKPVVERIRKDGWIVEADDLMSNPDGTGYGGVHLQLRNPETGLLHELQIHTEPTWEARARYGGHDLYDYFEKHKRIVTEADADHSAELLRYNREIYAEARDHALAGTSFPKSERTVRMHFQEGEKQGLFRVEDKDGTVLMESRDPWEARRFADESGVVRGWRAPSESSTRVNATPEATTPAASHGPPVSEGQPVRGKFRDDNPFVSRETGAESKLRGPVGREDQTRFQGTRFRTRYRIVEADDLIASNDPFNGFERDPRYPAGIQGRVYHGEAGKGAQERVVGMANNLDPSGVAHPSVTSHGPAVVTREGFTVSANQRTMAQKLAYRTGKGDHIKRELVSRASQVGIDPAEVEAMKHPVLVREIIDDSIDQGNHEALAKLNQLSDVPTVKAKDPLVLAAGRARQARRSGKALDYLARTIDPEQSLAEYLRSPQGPKVLQHLVDDEVILPQELDQFRDAATGRLSKYGRERIQEVVQATGLGGDVSVLNDAPDSILSKLDQSWPRLVKASSSDGWSLEEPMKDALRLHAQRVDNGMGSIGDVVGQSDMFGRAAEADSKGVQLAKFIEGKKKAEVTAAMREYAEAAEKAKASEGVDDIFGAKPETADDAFRRIFGETQRTGEEFPDMDLTGLRGKARAGAVGDQGYRLDEKRQDGPREYYVRIDTPHGPVGLSLHDLGEDLRVSYMWGAGGDAHITAHGPSGVREIGRILAKEFPEAKSIMGYRSTGARHGTAARPEVREGRTGGYGEFDLSKARPGEVGPSGETGTRIMSSIAGTGIGGTAGFVTGGKIGKTPEERRRNAALGAFTGAAAGLALPWMGYGKTARAAEETEPALAHGSSVAKNPQEIAGQDEIRKIWDRLVKEESEGARAGSVGDQAVTITKHTKYKNPSTGEENHRIRIATPKGEVTALIGVLDERDPATGFMEFVGLSNREHPDTGEFRVTMADENRLGPALTRQVLRKIREEMPDLKTLGGTRVGGARAARPGNGSTEEWTTFRMGEGRGRSGAVGDQPASLRISEPVLQRIARGERPTAPKDVDPDEFINAAKFGLDQTGEVRLKEEVQKIVAETGLQPKERVSWDQTKIAARHLGLTDLARADARPMTGPELLAVRNIVKRNIEGLERASRRLEELRVQPATKEIAATMARLEEFITAADRQNDQLLGRFVKARSESGRILNSLKIIAAQSDDPLVWLEKAKRVAGPDRHLGEAERTEILRLLNDGNKPGLVSYLMGLRKPVTALDAEFWTTLRKAGLLTNIKTQVRNALSNTAFQGLEIAKDVPASLVDALMAGYTGQRTKSFSPVAFTASWKGAKAGAMEARSIMRSGVSPEALARAELPHEVNFANPILDKYTKFVFRAQSAADRPFRLMALYRSLEEQSRILAKAEGLSGQALKERAAALVQAPTTEMTVRAISDAEHEVFQNKSVAGTAASSMKQGLRKLNSTAGAAADLVLPFVKTPGAVVGKVAEYTMGSLATPADLVKLVQAVRGKEEARVIYDLQKRLGERLGRQAVGALALYAGYKIAEKGLAGGPEPAAMDYTGREQMRTEGKQGNSVRIAGRWWNLPQSLGPLGNLLATGALLHQNAEDPEQTDPLMATAAGAVKGVTDQPFLVGFKDFMEGLTAPQDKAAAIGTNIAGSFVPAGAAGIARGMDPQPREVSDLSSSVKSRVPELSKTLPERVGPLGKNPPREDNTLASFLQAMVDPFSSTKDRTLEDPTIREMAKVGAKVGKPKREAGESTKDYHQRQLDVAAAVKQAIEETIASEEYRTIEEQADEESVSNPKFRGRRRRDIVRVMRRELIQEAASKARSNNKKARRAEDAG